jgi:hypothetical protein
MTYQELAASTAEAWSRPRTHPPVAPLEYVAGRCFWQAVNMCGFTGDLAAWLAEVRAALPPSSTPHTPGETVMAPVESPSGVIYKAGPIEPAGTLIRDELFAIPYKACTKEQDAEALRTRYAETAPQPEAPTSQNAPQQAVPSAAVRSPYSDDL